MTHDIRVKGATHPTEYKHRDGCYLALTHRGICEVPLAVWSEDPATTQPIVDQPDPVQNDRPAVWDMVVQDMKTRSWAGVKRYGTSLQPFNGRDALVDAYQEALDLAVYIRQYIYERDSK